MQTKLNYIQNQIILAGPQSEFELSKKINPKLNHSITIVPLFRSAQHKPILGKMSKMCILRGWRRPPTHHGLLACKLLKCSNCSLITSPTKLLEQTTKKKTKLLIILVKHPWEVGLRVAAFCYFSHSSQIQIFHGLLALRQRSNRIRQNSRNRLLRAGDIQLKHNE